MKMEIDVAEFAAQLTEMTLQAELETHLSQDLEKNRKNGISSKTMKSANGTFDLETP